MVFPLQSPTYFIEGCNYWFTATYIVEVDDNTGLVLNIATTNAQMNWSCPQVEIMYARNVSMSISVAGSRADSFVFTPTGDSNVDHLLNDQTFISDLKNLINLNLP